MPVNLSIKNAPDEIVSQLRRRAQRNHRSLQGEMLAILEDAVRLATEPPAPASSDRERDVERIVALMREGLPLDGHRFTRDEMHER